MVLHGIIWNYMVLFGGEKCWYYTEQTHSLWKHVSQFASPNIFKARSVGKANTTSCRGNGTLYQKYQDTWDEIQGIWDEVPVTWDKIMATWDEIDTGYQRRGTGYLRRGTGGTEYLVQDIRCTSDEMRRDTGYLGPGTGSYWVAGRRLRWSAAVPQIGRN